MWVVCEIEGKQIPVNFEVSALPKIWLLWQNGELFCYWPKTNASSKIRFCVEPKPDWSVYKCRLLMEGATFASYKAALEAEQISEGFSTFSAFRENATAKRKRNDYLSETDSNVGISPKKSSSSSCVEDAQSDSSVLYSDEEFIGNDSFEYNEGMKFSGPYLLENKNSIGNQLDLQLDETTKFPEKKTDLHSPQSSDYSTTFVNGTGILTSTILDSENNDGKLEVPTQINSQMAKIDAIISSFVKDVQHEMQLLKQMVQVQSTSSAVKGAFMGCETVNSLEKNYCNVAASKIEILDIEVLNSGCDEKSGNGSTIRVPNVSEYRKFDLDVGDKIGKVDFCKTLRATSVDDQTIGDTMFVNALKDDYVNHPNIEHQDVKTACNTDLDVTYSQVSNSKIHLPIKDPDMDVTYSQVPTSKIYLPIKDHDHYKEIAKQFLDEDISTDGSDTPLETALIDHLLPLDDEIEAEYMDRTIDMVFIHNFFLDSTSWKTEANRINLSVHSNVMSCWRKSFESKFGPDDRYNKFKRHFRRVKGAKRASDKAQLRKMQMLKNKLTK